MMPTARTLKHLREQGYHAAVVERWNHVVRIRQDLWGVFDVLAFWQSECVDGADESGVLAVQCTTADHQADRLAKLLAAPIVKDWLLAGNRLEVHGWRKGGARGKRKTWTVNVRQVTLADFEKPNGATGTMEAP